MTGRFGAGDRIVAFLNAYTEGMSGGDACFIELAKRLPGPEYVVVTSQLGAAQCRGYGLDATYWSTTRERRFSRTIPTYLLRTAIALRYLKRLRASDIVLATSDFLPDVLPSYVAKRRYPNVPWIQRAYHLIPPTRMIPHAAQRVSHGLIRSACDLVIVDNRMFRRELVFRGVSEDRIEVNYPGLDLSRYPPADPGALAWYDAAFVGRLHRSKGVFALVDIWRRVCATRPNAKLAIIGRGDEQTRADLQAAVRAAGLDDNIALLGFLETATVVATLQHSRVFVAPSPEEGFGMVILEALACGLPVVAWDLPVYREAFPAGLVPIPLNNVRAFAEAVNDLLADEERRRHTALAGHEHLARYDWAARAAHEATLLRCHLGIQVDKLPMVARASVVTG